MFKVRGFLDNKLVIDWRMANIPRTGDTVRFYGERYAKVTEVIWCLDEESYEEQRVNIRMESEVETAKTSAAAQKDQT